MIETPFARALAAGAADPVTLSEADVLRALTPSLILSTVEEVLGEIGAGDALSVSPVTLALDDADGPRIFKAMPGAVPRLGAAGVKWVASVDRNAGRGLPRAPATVVVTDPVTGALRGIVAGTVLTAYRTAAMACVAAKHAAARPARAAILGLGAIGQAAALLLPSALPVSGIRAWSRDAARVAHASDALTAASGVPVAPAASVAEAVDGADLVVTASGLSGDAPFLRRDMLGGGAFVCALGSYQEVAEDVLLAADRLVVDDWAACAKRGSLAPAVRTGAIERDLVDGTLADLVAGRLAPRAPGTGLTVACLTGIGVLDVALAARLLEAHGSASAL